jgi:hypothetical protein
LPGEFIPHLLLITRLISASLNNQRTSSDLSRQQCVVHGLLVDPPVCLTLRVFDLKWGIEDITEDEILAVSIPFILIPQPFVVTTFFPIKDTHRP